MPSSISYTARLNPARGCAQVTLIGARGSGETGSNGLGPEVAKTATAIAAELAAHKITMKVIPDPYRAGSVNDLIPTLGEIALILANPIAGAAEYYQQNVEKFIASVEEGITEAVLLAQGVHRICPHTLLVMAGYSQGAMAIHQAELRLAASHDTGVLDQIAATVLIADGDRVKDTKAKRLGTAKATAKGIRTWFGQNNGKDVVQPGTTADVCNAGDIVCDFALARVRGLDAANDAVKVHQSYTADHALTEAATWAADLLVKRIQPPTLMLAPRQGPPDTPITVTGIWFRPSESVTVTDATSPGSTVCATTATASGGFSCHGKIPAAAFFTRQQIVATGKTSRARAVAEFRVVSPWKPIRAPLPKGGNTLSSVSLQAITCSTASSCVAVGSYTDSSGRQQGLIEVFTGAAWTSDKAPLPSGAAANPQVHLDSISCGSVSSCAAVGNYTDSAGGQQGLLEVLSGTTWTADKAPRPSGATGNPGVVLNSVACSSASACVAVGWDNGEANGLIETLSHGTWTAAWAPAPADSQGAPAEGLYSVICVAGSMCLAVGYFFVVINSSTGAGYTAGVLETLTGGTWTPLEAPSPNGIPDGQATILTGVSCASQSACLAIGGDNGLPLIEKLSGGKWTAAYTPLPKDADTNPPDYAEITSAACPAASSCTAVGNYNVVDIGLSQAFLLNQMASGWVAKQAGYPPDTDRQNASLSSISCRSASACVAVGSYQASIAGSAESVSLIESLSGAIWTDTKTPTPPGAETGGSSYLTAISCPSTVCVAVGGYQDTTLGSPGMIITGPAPFPPLAVPSRQPARPAQWPTWQRLRTSWNRIWPEYPERS